MAPRPTRAILEPLRADPGGAAILCDIDGTLAPIVDDPEAAAVPAEARAVLAGAGRPLPPRRLRQRPAGERRARGSSASTSSPTPATTGSSCSSPARRRRASTRRSAIAGRRRPGSSSRLDWRRLGRLRACGSRTRARFRRSTGAAPPTRSLPSGARARDRRSRRRAGAGCRTSAAWCSSCGRSPIDKGSRGAAADRRAGQRTALFGGDDRTDLDAFAALRELRRDGTLDAAVCVGVSVARGRRTRSVATPTSWSIGPAGFRDLLRAL